MRDN